MIYATAFVILLGLASQNSKVNKCEKVSLSLLVPSGFITSTILALCVADSIIEMPFTFVFLP
jgi:hypothetical protein